MSFNRLWQQRLAQFRQFAGPPWWAPGLVLTPDIRSSYERYLPVRDFLVGLHALAADALPAPSWAPWILRNTLRGAACCGPRTPDCPSLPDLWQQLPPQFAGRVEFAAHEVLALLCALADPPRFGTDFGRYPEQLCAIRTWVAERPRCDVRILDIGCGTGQGTCEIAALLRECGVRNVRAVGLTKEPLEAWMAATRSLSHDLRRQEAYRDLPSVPAVFAVADARWLPVSGHFDLIACNGLVGGRFLHMEHDIKAFLGEVRRVLAPAGLATFANRFHEGRVEQLRRTADLAEGVGWSVAGDARLMLLRASVGSP